MWASATFRHCTTLFLLLGTAITSGCSAPEEESPQTRQAQAVADRKKALEFLKEDGEVDWRKRVDAASEALSQAKSDRKWGRNQQALEHALEAAHLMPPQSKDFDNPIASTAAANEQTDAEGGGGADGAAPEGGKPEGGKPEGGGGHESGGENGGPEQGGSGQGGSGQGGSDSDGTNSGGSVGTALPTGGGNSVSNDEVQQLRESLETLLESLDGKTGRASSDLSFERDAIEIR